MAGRNQNLTPSQNGLLVPAQLLSASDAALASGFLGVEAAGNIPA
jgi:hypothetical protein